MSRSTPSDPFDWTTTDFKKWASGTSHDKDFWQALADNNCDGEVLLTSIDLTTINNYLGIRVLKRALGLLRHIDVLRSQSVKYQLRLHSSDVCYIQDAPICSLSLNDDCLVSHQALSSTDDARYLQDAPIRRLSCCNTVAIAAQSNEQASSSSLPELEFEASSTAPALSDDGEQDFTMPCPPQKYADTDATAIVFAPSLILQLDESSEAQLSVESAHDTAHDTPPYEGPPKAISRSLPTKIRAEDVFMLDNSSLKQDFTKAPVVKHPVFFDIRRKYVQTAMHRAALSTMVTMSSSAGPETVLCLSSTKDRGLLCLVARTGEDPKLSWQDTAADIPRLSSWFEHIDWESRLSKYGDHDNSILPIFGASDEEDANYGSDILDDIEAEERETCDVLENKDRALVPLSNEEKHKILHEQEAEYVLKWQEKHLQALELKARHLWKQYHRDRNHRQAPRLKALQAENDDTVTRRIKLIDHILENIYHSKKAPQKQCEALRETIYQLKEQEFLLALYSRPQSYPPELVPALAATRSSVTSSKKHTNKEMHSDSDDSKYTYEDMDAKVLDIVDDTGDSEEDRGSAIASQASLSDDSDIILPGVIKNASGARAGSSRKTAITLTSDNSEDDHHEPVVFTIPTSSSPRLRKRKRQPANRPLSADNLIEHDRLSGSTSQSMTLTTSTRSSEEQNPFFFKPHRESGDEDDDASNGDSQAVRSEAVETGSKNTKPSKLAKKRKSPAPISKKSTAKSKSGSNNDSSVRKNKKKRPVKFNSDSESAAAQEGGKKKKKRKIRPVNEQAAARRQAQRDQRQAILQAAARERPQSGTGQGAVINQGDREVDEYIHIDLALSAKLEGHQLEGVRFIWRECIMLAEVSGCLLAHTMGLGKTLQVIVFLNTLGTVIREAKSLLPREMRRPFALVLCPPSLVPNWTSEFVKWTKQNAMGAVFDFKKAMKDDDKIETIREWADEGGILLMSVNSFTDLVLNRRGKEPRFDDPGLAKEVLSKLTTLPRVVIADEAHSFKNDNTLLNSAIHKVKTKCRIALTGSPLSNNLMEYFAMIDWIDPGHLGSKADFKHEFVRDIEDGNKVDATKGEIKQGQKKLHTLVEIIGDKVDRKGAEHLKRLLPDKYEYVIFLRHTPLQCSIYNDFLETIKNHSSGSGRSQSASILGAIGHLRWIVDSPALLQNAYHGPDASGKSEIEAEIASMAEDAMDPVDADVHQVAKSGNTLQLWHTWRQSILERYAAELTRSHHSHKVDVLLAICKGAALKQEKVLIFSYAIAAIKYLSKCLRALNYPVKILTGQSGSVSTRVRDVKLFNEAEGFSIYLVSTKAGGIGLNICGANRVILFDHEFNPILQEQAVGRAYRLGQTKVVSVYKLQIDQSYEIKLFEQALRKQGLIGKVVDKKHMQTNMKQNFMMYLAELPETGRPAEDFEPPADDLLAEILNNPELSKQIVSIQPTESFHDEGEDLLDDADRLEAARERAAFIKMLEDRRVAAEQAEAMLAAADLQKVTAPSGDQPKVNEVSSVTGATNGKHDMTPTATKETATTSSNSRTQPSDSKPKQKTKLRPQSTPSYQTPQNKLPGSSFAVNDSILDAFTSTYNSAHGVQ